MNEVVSEIQDIEKEHFIPTKWRSTLCEVVNAFVADDFELNTPIKKVLKVGSDIANHNRAYVQDYGEKLCILSDEVWDYAKCQWMGGHWDFIVDLCTQSEGISDLALHGKARPKNKDIEFEIGMIYVP